MMLQIPYGVTNWAVTKYSHPAEDISSSSTGWLDFDLLSATRSAYFLDATDTSAGRGAALRKPLHWETRTIDGRLETVSTCGAGR